jgi:hypothetical protein
VGKQYQDFIISSCGQTDLEPQFTICNFKKASHGFKIIFQFSLKTGKSFFFLLQKKQFLKLQIVNWGSKLGCPHDKMIKS